MAVVAAFSRSCSERLLHAGGKRKSVDVSPQATAIRELFEETAGKPLSPSRKLADATQALEDNLCLIVPGGVLHTLSGCLPVVCLARCGCS